MGSSKKSKKIMHKVSWYTLEYAEKEHIFKEYEKIFDQDFKDEINYIKSKEEKNEKPKSEKTENENETVINPEEKDFHNIFRAIAKKTHPDLHGEKHEETFKLANEAYNNKNWSELISIASELDISIPEFNQTTINMIEENICSMKQDMKVWRDSLAAVWAEAKNEDDKRECRKKIRFILGIDEEDFKKFIDRP